MRTVLRALLLMGVALPASADTALVVGTVDQSATTSYGAPRYLGTALTPLDQAGFRLLTAVDADSETLRGLVSQLASTGEDSRLVIALSGRFVQGGGLTWFLGRDAGQQDLGSVSGFGVPVELLMDLAAQSEADVVILLAPEDQGISLGAGLEDGIGPLDIPEGVTLATGHPASVARFLRSELLVPGRPLRDSFASAPGLTVQALTAPYQPFVPAPVTTPTVPPAEQSYWESMVTLDNAFAYRAYLNRYPNGYYAGQARARIAELEPPQPQLTPEERENALSLSREERRDIQRDLAVLGYYNSGIDGIFGQGTRGGIRSWQQANGIQVTGYMDAEQITRLSDQGDVRREQIRAEDRAYWQQTGSGQDEAGLRSYLGRYPNGEYSDLARQRLQAIEAEQERQADIAYWNQTGRGQDIAGLRAYLNRYPNGEFSQLATQRLNQMTAQQEQQAWQQAQAIDTIQSYRRFLNDYPNGPHASQARQRLQQLEQVAGEASAWQQAQAADTIQSYRRYLNDYPNGPHANQARQRLQQLQQAAGEASAWQTAQSTDTIQGYRDYLNAYPNGPHRQAAQNRIDAIRVDDQAWQQAQATDTIQGYRDYLNAFGAPRHAQAARARIAELQNGGADPALGRMGSGQLQLAAQALRQFEIPLSDNPTELEIIQGIREYQRRLGLPQTGYLDPATTANMVINGLMQN